MVHNMEENFFRMKCYAFKEWNTKNTSAKLLSDEIFFNCKNDIVVIEAKRSNL